MNNNCNTYTDINRLAELSALECVLILSPAPESTTQHSCHLDIRLLGIMCNSEKEVKKCKIWGSHRGAAEVFLYVTLCLLVNSHLHFKQPFLCLQGKTVEMLLWNISNYLLLDTPITSQKTWIFKVMKIKSTQNAVYLSAAGMIITLTILYYSYRALSLIKHTILNQQIHSYFFYRYYILHSL
jgi:hypothetical protein